MSHEVARKSNLEGASKDVEYAITLLARRDRQGALNVLRNPLNELTPEQRTALEKLVMALQVPPTTSARLAIVTKHLFAVIKPATEAVVEGDQKDLLVKVLSFLQLEGSDREPFQVFAKGLNMADLQAQTRRELLAETKKVEGLEALDKLMQEHPLGAFPHGRAQFFQELPKLRYFAAYQCTPEQLEEISQGIVTHCKNFKTLNLCRFDHPQTRETLVPFQKVLKKCITSGENPLDLSAVKFLKTCPLLYSLEHNSIKDGKIFKAICDIPQLRELHLSVVHDSEIAFHLDELQKLPLLRTLTILLHGKEVLAENAEPAARRAHEQAEAARIASIDSLLKLKKLENLDISSSDIDDEVLLGFATLTNLQEINLDYCKRISKKGVSDFLQASRKNLRTIYVNASGGSLLRRNDIPELQREFPDITFMRREGQPYPKPAPAAAPASAAASRGS